MSSLEELGRRLNALARPILQLVGKRQETSREIIRAKRDTGQATRDYTREREVLMAARETGRQCGVSPQVAENILRLLIRSSLTTQEQASVAAQGAGSGRTALIIGGSGKIGRWFTEFMTSQGFAVTVADPVGAPAGFEHVADWRTTDLRHDFIVVATPLGLTDKILRELAMRRPKGVIFDVGSLKSPLRAGLNALKSHGCRVTSVHPMFGPDTELLSGRHVIFVEAGSPDATQAARDLFASTMVEQVVMSLEDHDRLIAYVLGLSHALNIAFFTALAESGEAAPKLATLSSTTFDAQLGVAAKVARENPDLYFEIQTLNDYGTESLAALLYAVERLRSIVRANDVEGFRSLMTRGKGYLKDRARL